MSFYSLQIPSHCNAKEAECWIFIFAKNYSPFSLGISTENIPAGCSNSLWNVIRHQRHERDQHLAYLEGVESGLVYLFPDIMLLGELRRFSGSGGVQAFRSENHGLSLQPWALWGWVCAPMSTSQGTLSPLKAMASPSTWHEGRDWQQLPGLPAPLLLPGAWNATTPPRQVTRSGDQTPAQVVWGQAAGKMSQRGMSSAGQWAWLDAGSFELNWRSLRHQRITVLNLSEEAMHSPWKTQSYRNASLDFTWI